MLEGWKAPCVILTCYSLTNFENKKKKPQLHQESCEERASCNAGTEHSWHADFHIIGGFQKWASELISWRGHRQVRHGEEKAVSQRHCAPVWDSRQPKEGPHGGPAQLPRQPWLCVFQVGTSRRSPWWLLLPDRYSLKSSFVIPWGSSEPRGKRKYSLSIWAGGSEGSGTVQGVGPAEQTEFYHCEGKIMVSAFCRTFYYGITGQPYSSSIPNSFSGS